MYPHCLATGLPYPAFVPAIAMLACCPIKKPTGSKLPTRMSHAGRFGTGLLDAEDSRCRRLLEEVAAVVFLENVDVRVLEE